MDNFFIKQLPDGTWGQPQYRPDLANYSIDALRADNLFALVVSPTPMADIDKTLVTTYEKQGDTVYQRHTFVAKEGAEMAQAIKIKWSQIRYERGLMLVSSDWTQLGDVPLAADRKVAWATYRQELRDITTQTNPFNITWPTNPDGISGSIGVARV